MRETAWKLTWLASAKEAKVGMAGDVASGVSLRSTPG